MLDELRRCGIYDDVAQWQSLDDLLHSLTTFSTCWNYCFPGLPPPSIPVEEYESITQLPWLGLILEVLVVVRIALQIPNCAMSNSHHTVANRYELHRCRCAAYLLISFLQRLISQDHGYFPPFFEVLHFYKTSLLCEIITQLSLTRDIYAHCGRDFLTSTTSYMIQVIINNRASTFDFPHGTHHTMLGRLIRMFYVVNTHAVASFYNYFVDGMPSLNRRFTTGNDPILTGSSALYQWKSNFQFPRCGFKKANGNTYYARI